jgi:hypothetical protein
VFLCKPNLSLGSNLISEDLYVEELLADRVFANRLAPLKQNVGRVWEIVVADNKLPDPPALQSIDLPDEFKKGTLAQRIGNIVKAIVLSKHRAESVNAIKAIVERYIGARLRVGIRIQFVESRAGAAWRPGLYASRRSTNPFRSDQRGKSGCGYSANAGAWYAATNHLE